MHNRSEDILSTHKLYQQLIKLDPNTALNYYNYALFMQYRQNNLDQTEDLYAKAYELESDNEKWLDTYVTFMHNQHRNLALT